MIKLLNETKLLQTDFVSRFLGFVEKYDAIYNINHYNAMQNHIDSQNFDVIRSFLKHIYYKNLEPASFSIHQFISMNIADFEYYQEHYTKISALKDEGKSLYKEFLSFYSIL